ncbi:alpha-glucuronidase family glycosyl hydrolase [Actinopolymorpha sp. B11F2]|uniref:alpha-glucuronidase family glycosyl hydrolase n=1 Tax=Actinopolymorpha sp. B11F2 TaxID=3160862 RepID=UPI0032E41FDB
MGPEFTRRSMLAGSAALVGAGLLADPTQAFAALATGEEDGHELWLRYRLVSSSTLLNAYRRTLTHVVSAGGGAVLRSAVDELRRGVSGLTGREVREEDEPVRDGAVIVGTPESSALVAHHVDAAELARLGPEGYVLRRRQVNGLDAILVASNGDRGVLYGAFHLLRLLQTHQRIDALDIGERPVNQLRLANHWDNLDRSVERGYAGPSIFHWDELPTVLPHYVDYARALASVGMNGTVVNNVNANPEFLSTEMLEKLTALTAVLRAWGVTLYLSANFASPIVLGGLSTADPFDADVQAWWRDKAREVYDLIPDLGGFLVKADSEGQPGPLTYGRTHADGANLLAEAVRSYGGIVMWRAFVHDFNPQTWAHKSYETFTPLDGEFAENVVLQIKNGPIDFQVREPVHPLFGALPRTNSMLELQITQEYTGQSTHLCYLVPMWKEVYDFDTHATGAGPLVADIIDGSAYGYAHSGVAGVMNVGSDTNWTGHHLAAANTHGFGRLAWNPGLAPAEIADEWVRMTFGPDRDLVQVLTQMLLRSWEIYEAYTSPLGVGFLIGGDHFTPDPWGNVPWHQADAEGTGFDRTVATGIGYTGLYHPPVARMYESLATCPDELLLFMHHVPYGHRLHSGKTVIQHIYDSHFDGLDQARRMRQLWKAVGSRVDARRYAETLERFDGQVEQAVLWRDAVVGLYFEQGKVLDEKREWVQVRPAETAVLLGGWPNVLKLRVGNASPKQREVTVGVAAAPGWSSGTDTAALASREFGVLAVPITPPIAPEIGMVQAAVEAGGLPVLGPSTPVITAPAGPHCVLALDAGSVSSPLLPGYRRLSPSSGWDAAVGYGWVGAAPQSRDRGGPDTLRRDFVNDTTARTLRIALPAGVFDAYVLVGDAGAGSWPTFVRADGELMAESVFLENNSYVWLRFSLDGGADGREVDLELSGAPDQHWHLNALVVRDPAASPPRAGVGAVEATSPMFGGQDSAVTVDVVNLTDADIAFAARVEVPAGWSAQDAVATVPAGAGSSLEVTVVAAGTPMFATLRVGVTADGEPVGDDRLVDVLAVPPGDAALLALDAGPASAPLLAGYRRLSPENEWDGAVGYGWVGAAPQSRDRAVLDPLRRDFVNDVNPRVLRISVPAGECDAFLLVGDGTQPSPPTYVRSGGVLVGESPALGVGEFAWVGFTLDGGSSGREVDLELSGVPAEHWRVNSLVVMSR